MNANELEFLRQRAKDARALIAERQEKLDANPDDLSTGRTLSSLRYHLEDLNRQLLVLEQSMPRNEMKDTLK